MGLSQVYREQYNVLNDFEENSKETIVYNRYLQMEYRFHLDSHKNYCGFSIHE